MTDKVQKIREELVRLREKIMGIRTDFADGQKSVLTELLVFIDSLQEEPVSEELEEAASVYQTFHRFATPFKAYIDGCKWMKEKMMKDAIDAEVDDN